MQFTDFEKNIIREIKILDEQKKLNVLGNILEFKLFNEEGYYIKILSEKECVLKIEENYFNSLNKDYGVYGVKYLVETITDDLLTIIRLFHFLDRNEYITVTGDFPFDVLGIETVNAKYISYGDFDEEIKSLLFRYARKRIKPTPKLYELVKNDFMDEEEHRFSIELKQTNKTQRLSIIAIIISAIGMTAQILTTIFNTSKVQLEQPVKIEIDKRDINSNLSSIANNIKSKEIIIKLKDNRQNK